MNFTSIKTSSASSDASIDMSGKNVLKWHGTNTPTLTLTGLVDGQLIIVINQQTDPVCYPKIEPVAAGVHQNTIEKTDAAMFYYSSSNGLHRIVGDEY